MIVSALFALIVSPASLGLGPPSSTVPSNNERRQLISVNICPFTNCSQTVHMRDSESRPPFRALVCELNALSVAAKSAADSADSADCRGPGHPCRVSGPNSFSIDPTAQLPRIADIRATIEPVYPYHHLSILLTISISSHLVVNLPLPLDRSTICLRFLAIPRHTIYTSISSYHNSQIFILLASCSCIPSSPLDAIIDVS